MVSYSHQDEVALGRLHTHLAVLRRDGRIDDWFDRDILAGGELDPEIAEQLESCSLFLLLVSPDFLASDYCVEREMERALERHDSGEARVVPIIVEPCDWMSTPLRNLRALPRDSRPISDWPNANNAYLDVVQELRRILETEEVPPASGQERAAIQPRPSPSGDRRYHIRRSFDEIDRSDFRDAAFCVIEAYFDRAIAEIDDIENLRGRFSSLSATSFTCTIVDRARQHSTAHITVHSRRKHIGFGDISYSFQENAPLGSINGAFTIESDEYELFLSPILMGIGRQDERLTPEAAAEQLWEVYLQHAGITYD